VRFVRLLLLVVLLALVARLVDVQVLRSGQYQSLARHELAVTVPIPAVRGGLYDRNGRVLAASVPTEDIYADDFLVRHPVLEADALAPLLGVPATQLAGELHRPSGDVPLAKQVPEAKAKGIIARGFDGLWLGADAERLAPDGSLAAPVLGFTNASGAGAAGLESRYDQLLAGTPGTETLLESPSGVALPGGATGRRSPGRAGTGLELTLDESLQYEAEQALASAIETSHALSGTAVIMDVHSGDVLAMANLTAKGPTSGAAGAVPGGGSAGGAAPGSVVEASQNLATNVVYEPGSVFKLVTFSAALQDGLVSPGTVFSVPDHLELDGSTFHDAEPHATEQLTATQILAQSSNIGTSEVAQGVGESRLLAQVEALGFGQPTGLGFPGESNGLLVGAAQWEPTDLVSLPIGQVDAVTPQQILDAYNAIADGGVFVAPRVVRATVGPDDRLTAAAPAASHTVVSPTVDTELTNMLQQVVLSGTGTNAEIPGYTVAGKTGTAQIPTPGHDSYIPGAYMATFVGFAPAIHPVFSAIVVLDRPTPIFGGTVAAPVFSQIVGYALHRYDIPTTPGASAQAQPASGAATAAQVQDIT
jgi:cell division protein FtsI (penicillin-binding protein 3)